MPQPNVHLSQVLWVLRVGVAMEFIGHGVLGLNHPPAWASYFAMMGIPKVTALTLMTLVGAIDIIMALGVLFYPARGAILYMAAWGIGTALLRPMAGESFWEAIERAGNFGAPFALFFLARADTRRSWFCFKPVDALKGTVRLRVSWVLRLTTTAALAGHGALGLSTQAAFQHAVLANRPSQRVD